MTNSSFLRKHVARLVAILFIVVTYVLTLPPRLSIAERNELASRFKFSKQQLPEVSANWSGHSQRQIRSVHPSLNHIDGWISSVGAAAALEDLDKDGLPNDVCYVDTRIDMVIVGPVPGTGNRYEPFSLNPAPLQYDAATTAPMGCLPGDLNEDGYLDLLVYYWGRTPIAFLRQGNRYVPREVIAERERWFTNAANLADLNGDGHADLIIANYFPDDSRILDANAGGQEVMQESMSTALNGGKKHLLLWKGSRAVPDPAVQFSEVKDVFPAEVDRGWTLAIGAIDLDGDLLPELYFANDFGPDRLLHNRSSRDSLRFQNVKAPETFTTPHSSAVGRDSFKGMGVDFADLNSDGLPDIYVSNITTEYGLLESNFLFLSTGRPDLFRNGAAPYVNRSEQLGLSRSGWAWDAKLADFDNDGVPEAMQAMGFLKGTTNRWPELQELAMSNDRLLRHPRSWPQFRLGDDLSGNQHNPFFVRSKDGRYHDLADDVGLGEPNVSRGIAIADVDGDGRLDFVFANQWEPSWFWHNESPSRNQFLGLHLLLPVGTTNSSATVTRAGHPGPNTLAYSAIGAKATVYLPNGNVLVSHVDGGNGHSGKRSRDLNFGLGSIPANKPLRVEIQWRDSEGRRQSEILFLTPEWHTLILGRPSKGEVL